MKLKILKTEKEYNDSLERLNQIFDAEPNSKAGQEAELLSLLIEDYEEENYKIDAPDPIIAVKLRMEEMELKQKDLIGLIDSKGIVSEVLKFKRI